MENKDFILQLYKDKRTVFRLSDVAMLFRDAEVKYLSDRMSYYAQTDRLLNLRKGIYVKPEYNPLELANVLYTPSYISLEYVLQQAGVIFQYGTSITSVSYLSRTIEIDGNTYIYRKIKEETIMDTTGIIRNRQTWNQATPERAFLDMLYLNKEFYFDNIHSLDKELVLCILPAYRSISLKERVIKLLESG